MPGDFSSRPWAKASIFRVIYGGRKCKVKPSSSPQARALCYFCERQGAHGKCWQIFIHINTLIDCSAFYVFWSPAASLLTKPECEYPSRSQVLLVVKNIVHEKYRQVCFLRLSRCTTTTNATRILPCVRIFWGVNFCTTYAWIRPCNAFLTKSRKWRASGCMLFVFVNVQYN
jgi:hypothetical protein